MDIVTYALLKKQIGGLSKSIEAISEGMTFKGSVPTEADLPSNPGNGDLYIIEDTGTKAVWDGSKWIKFDNTVEVNIEPLDGSIVVKDTKVGVKISTAADNVLELKSDGLYVKKVEGGGSGELEADLVVSNAIGRYTNGQTISEGTSFETIFRGMLSKVSYPTLTNPSATISFNIPQLVEIGENVNGASTQVTFNRGSINPKYTAESGYRSGAATGYTASLSGASVEYSDTNTTGQFTIPTFTKNSKGIVTLTGKVDYAAGCQPKDSDGNNYQSPLPAGSVSATKQAEFIIPFFFGYSDSLEVSSLDGFTKKVEKKGTKTFTYEGKDMFTVIAFDSAYTLNTILDENGFPNEWIQTSVTYKNQTLTAFVSPFALSGFSMKYTFEFK